MADFEYIVTRGDPPKLCFGSMSERKIVTFHKPGHYSNSLGPENIQKIFKGSFLKASRFDKNKPKYESVFYDFPKTKIKPTVNLFKQTGREDKFNQIVPGFVFSLIYNRAKTNLKILLISVSEDTK